MTEFRTSSEAKNNRDKQHVHIMPECPTEDVCKDVCDRRDLKLKEAEKTIANKDVIIKMLQDQVKKLEESYKHNLKATEDFRYKYCLASEQVKRLRSCPLHNKERRDKQLKDLREFNDQTKRRVQQCKMVCTPVELSPNAVLKCSNNNFQEIKNFEQLMKDYYEMLQLLAKKVLEQKNTQANSDDKVKSEQSGQFYPTLVTQLQKEISRLKDENTKLNEQIEDWGLKDFPLIKDSVLETYKKSNNELRHKVEILAELLPLVKGNVFKDESEDDEISDVITEVCADMPRRVSFSSKKILSSIVNADQKENDNINCNNPRNNEVQEKQGSNNSKTKNPSIEQDHFRNNSTSNNISHENQTLGIAASATKENQNQFQNSNDVYRENEESSTSKGSSADKVTQKQPQSGSTSASLYREKSGGYTKRVNNVAQNRASSGFYREKSEGYANKTSSVAQHQKRSGSTSRGSCRPICCTGKTSCVYNVTQPQRRSASRSSGLPREKEENSANKSGSVYKAIQRQSRSRTTSTGLSRENKRNSVDNGIQNGSPSKEKNKSKENQKQSRTEHKLDNFTDEEVKSGNSSKGSSDTKEKTESTLINENQLNNSKKAGTTVECGNQTNSVVKENDNRFRRSNSGKDIDINLDESKSDDSSAKETENGNISETSSETAENQNRSQTSSNSTFVRNEDLKQPGIDTVLNAPGGEKMKIGNIATNQARGEKMESDSSIKSSSDTNDNQKRSNIVSNSLDSKCLCSSIINESEEIRNRLRSTNASRYLEATENDCLCKSVNSDNKKESKNDEPRERLRSALNVSDEENVGKSISSSSSSVTKDKNAVDKEKESNESCYSESYTCSEDRIENKNIVKSSSDVNNDQNEMKGGLTKETVGSTDSHMAMSFNEAEVLSSDAEPIKGKIGVSDGPESEIVSPQDQKNSKSVTCSVLATRLIEIRDKIVELVEKQTTACEELAVVKNHMTMARGSTQSCNEEILKLKKTIEEQNHIFLVRLQENKDVTDDLKEVNGQIKTELNVLKDKMEILFKNVEELKNTKKEEQKILDNSKQTPNKDDIPFPRPAETKDVVKLEECQCEISKLNKNDGVGESMPSSRTAEFCILEQHLFELQREKLQKDKQIKCLHELINYYNKINQDILAMHPMSANVQKEIKNRLKDCKCSDQDIHNCVEKIREENHKLKTTISSVIDRLNEKLKDLTPNDNTSTTSSKTVRCLCLAKMKKSDSKTNETCYTCQSDDSSICLNRVPCNDQSNKQPEDHPEIQIEDIYNAVLRSVVPFKYGKCDESQKPSCSYSSKSVKSITCCCNVNIENYVDGQKRAGEENNIEDIYKTVLCSYNSKENSTEEKQEVPINQTKSDKSIASFKEPLKEKENCSSRTSCSGLGNCLTDIEQFSDGKCLMTNLKSYVQYLHEQLQIISNIENQIEDLRVDITTPQV